METQITLFTAVKNILKWPGYQISLFVIGLFFALAGIWFIGHLIFGYTA